jgi:prepilin-type N-terminal cleavage/methylation domain-containing protein
VTGRGPRRPRPRDPRGFTLIELMVVCTILGMVLLLVPRGLDGQGARGRLEQGASMVAAAILEASDQAIIDGHAVILEYDLEEDRFRYHVSARVRERAVGLDPNAIRTEVAEPDEEWMEMDWIDLPEDVDLAAYSEAKETWEKSRSQTIQITATPEGIVRPAHALRVESRSLPRGMRTMTVRVNALTSLSEVVPGEAEMPEKRDPHDFR